MKNARQELLRIAGNCRRVPEYPPRSFYEAMQFIWFTQIGGILSENPLALNPGRFDQYMYPYYRQDIDAGVIKKEDAQELIDALWLKYSEWVWTISANTADYFAGYNQFQNLTVGGKTREGLNASKRTELYGAEGDGRGQDSSAGPERADSGGLSGGVYGGCYKPGEQGYRIPGDPQ